MTNKPPKIEDVAKLAGVSTATVSRCLNNADQVRKPTREKVQAAIEALGYTPNFGGRVLASNRTGTVGVVIPTMDNAIFAESMQVMEQALAKDRRNLFISTSQYLPEREAEQISALLARGVDGLVLIGSEARPEVDAIIDMREVPCIHLWTAKPFANRMTIGFNNEEAAYRLAQNVCELGHRDIAMLAGVTEGNGRAQGRVRGVRAALAEYNTELPGHWLVEARYSFEDAASVMRQWLDAPKLPSAVICGNDVLAIGAISALNLAGIKVPNEVSVVGFDDLEISRIITPNLTTVRVPHRRMGLAAARAMSEWLDTGKRPDDIRFEVEIISRDSLASPS